MIRAIRLATATVSIFLAACGNLQMVPVAKMPASLAGKSVAISDIRPTKDEVSPRSFEVPNKSIFVVQSSGGSLALGLLLGPIGVLANAANIDRITKEAGESGQQSALYKIDAKEEATLVLSEPISKLINQRDVEKISLKPYVVFFIAGEKEGIDVVVKLRAEASIVVNGKPIPWVGNYAAYSKEVLPYDSLTKTMASGRAESLRAEIRGAYVELLDELIKDLSAASPPKRDIAWVKSRVLGIGMPGDIDRNAKGHLVLRNAWNDSFYNAIVFQDDKQYTFDNGPVPRDSK